MDLKRPPAAVLGDEKYDPDTVKYDSEGSSGVAEGEVQNGKLERGLKGRHMQMIAIGMLKRGQRGIFLLEPDRDIGGSIGAGLFVGSGAAFHNGGPGSVVSTSTRLLARSRC